MLLGQESLSDMCPDIISKVQKINFLYFKFAFCIFVPGQTNLQCIFFAYRISVIVTIKPFPLNILSNC